MKRVLLIVSTAALAACQESGIGGFKSGMWATEVKLAAGANELWSSKVERCIDPVAGDDPVIGILSASPFGPCQAVESHYDGGKVSILAHCMGRPGAMIGAMPQSRVRVDGTYSGTMIDAPLTAELVHEPRDSELTGKLDAKRTGDCPG